ncbi:MAG: TadE family protein [Actinomycetota bacterium]|jgi:Flp pilus assembly protein TadG
MKRNIFVEESGSASVEFVLLAIPLFLPIFIFMANFAELTDSHAALRTLARESARAFVLSENDATAYRVAAEVVDKGSVILGYQGLVTLDISCSESPCISPNGRVTATVTSHLKGTKKVSVSAIEYVSPWS